MKTIAFIPLRGGSKSIPLKNLRPIAGKPLFQWTLEAAVVVPDIECTFVSTDSPEIRSLVENLGLKRVTVVDRGADTATDSATTESALLEFAAEHDFERIILIQATSPLLEPEDLIKGLIEFDRSGADSLLSVVPQKRFIWQRTSEGLGRPENYNPAARPRRQDYDPYWVENGAYYITSREALLESQCRLSGRIVLVEMKEETYCELDEPSDWLLIENLLLAQKEMPVESSAKLPMESLRERARGIKLVLSDVDGVLTDSGMYYSETGDELKKFNTRDGKAFELLRHAGIKTGIITAENTRIVEQRAQKLKLDILEQGAMDKREVLERVLQREGLGATEVAYIGDDLGDIAIIEQVGLSACPSDAIVSVADRVDYQCEKRGGEGCLREVVERIFEL